MNLKEIGKQVAIVLAAGVMAAGCCTTKCDKAKCDAKCEKEPIYVLCRFDLKQGKADEYVKAVNEITAAVRAEKGCRFYFLAGDADTSMAAQQRFGKDVLWMIECWDDEESLKAHLQAPHMKAFGPKARQLRHSNTFHILKEYK